MGKRISNILVTGGAGYIGSHTVKKLLEQGYNVIIIDSLVKGHSWSVEKRAKFYKVNLANKESIRKVFQENKIDTVIHFASFIEAGESMKDPAKFFRNNLINTLNLLDIMIEQKVLSLVFSSTAAIYGELKYIPIDENHPKEPTNYYGLSKLMVEQILESYNQSYGLKFVCLRYFNASGADESGLIGEDHHPETHLIPLVLQVATGKREKIFIYGNDYNTKDGTGIRDYIHVNDLAQAHILSMEKLPAIKKLCLNLGSGDGYSVMEVIDTCKRVTGKEIKTEISQRRAGDPAILIADYSLAKNVLGWEPRYNLSKIIETAWRWHNKS